MQAVIPEPQLNTILVVSSTKLSKIFKSSSLDFKILSLNNAVYGKFFEFGIVPRLKPCLGSSTRQLNLASERASKIKVLVSFENKCSQ